MYLHLRLSHVRVFSNLNRQICYNVKTNMTVHTTHTSFLSNCGLQKNQIVLTVGNSQLEQGNIDSTTEIVPQNKRTLNPSLYNIDVPSVGDIKI